MVLQNEKEPKKGGGSLDAGGGSEPPGESMPTASSSSSPSSSANGQPVIKRQRIETSAEADVVDSSSGGASSSGNSSLVASACSSSTSLSSSPPSSGASSAGVASVVAGGGGSEEDLRLRQVQDYQGVFQDAIAKQCLCGLETNVLLMSFQSYYVCSGGMTTGRGVVRQLVPLIEWPFEYLLKFLSNVQLLFDTYLKQSIKGHICAGVLEVCNYLIRSEHQQPELDFVSMNIDEIIGLCNYNNKFINYLSGRILSSFLIIIKDDQDDRWLGKIVANLFDFNELNILSIRKINFSLDIIKQIVEWKDETEHPLDDTVAGQEPSTSAEGSSSGGFHAPPIENNYFAIHYGTSSDQPSGSIFNPASAAPSNSQLPHPAAAAIGLGLPVAGSVPICHIISLTDSESFDTLHIKCETISILGNKWPALVEKISDMIERMSHSQHAQNSTTIAAETCILTFLRLWESIISVKANLSVVETQPFQSQLAEFQKLLLSTKNPVIYKQMLTLFNEALCYGSTLALQDFIPEEVTDLAHNVVRSVKDNRILNKMPKSTYSSVLGFIGNKARVVRYQDNRISRVSDPNGRIGIPGTSGSSLASGPSNANSTNSSYDRTLLQKMALLVLKSVAVVVKEIRYDSSDSSVDSTDIDMSEVQQVERVIRDVVRRLATFLKIQLEFHPDSHFSKVLIHLFDDQDDYLVEAMVCTLDVTSGISFRNNAFPELIAMLNPVYTFIEFSNLGPNITHLFLDLLISTETCFLLFLLRFLKYVRQNWSMFTQSCLNYYQHNSYSNASTLLQSRHGSGIVINSNSNNVILDSVMTVLISLRLRISRLVAETLFPYNIGPILRLIENCESLYDGNELS